MIRKKNLLFSLICIIAGCIPLQTNLIHSTSISPNGSTNFVSIISKDLTLDKTITPISPIQKMTLDETTLESPLSQSLIPTQGLINTSTSVPPQIYNALPFPNPRSFVKQQCLTILDKLSNSLNLTGVLVLDTRLNMNWQTTNPLRKVYQMDFAKGETIQMVLSKEQNAFNAIYNFSPDQKKYFYIELLPDQISTQLHILSVTGKEQMVPSWDKTWGWNVKWLNDQQIIVFPKDKIRVTDGTAIILNINDDTWKEYPFHFHFPINIDITMISFNPTLSQVIYFSGENYVLRDVVNLTDQWIKGIVELHQNPVWLTDGKQVAVVVTDKNQYSNNDKYIDDIFLVNSKGKEIQLTKLNKSYPSMTSIIIDNQAWSPNGQYIAFLVSANDNIHKYKDKTLEILNIKTGQVIDTCLTVSDNTIVWSPDGKQLVITSPENYNEYWQNSHSGKEYQTNVVLVDMQSFIAYKIFSNATAIGWTFNNTP